MIILEKLLVPALSSRVIEQGYDAVSGPVYRAEDLLGATPLERYRAHGLEGDLWQFANDPDHVDVIRFPVRPCMQLTTPNPAPAASDAEYLMPRFEVGFLRNAAPVWDLAVTRVPTESRFVRIHRDGSQSEYSQFDGPARGWQGAKGYFPPLHLIGPRAKWQGMDLPGAFINDDAAFELVWQGDGAHAPAGFEQTWPGVFVKTVPVAECDEVFEFTITGAHRGSRVRVLQNAGDERLIQLLDPTTSAINETRSSALDPWLFQTIVPAAEVTDLEGVVSTSPSTAAG